MRYRDIILKQLRHGLDQLPTWVDAERRDRDVVLFVRKPSWVVDLSKIEGSKRRPGRPDPQKHCTRCPIYRALTPRGRLDLEMRMPGLWNAQASLADKLFVEALNGHAAHPKGGVSPMTAMGLLTPEPWVVLGRGRVAPQVIVPDPVAFINPRTGRREQRRAEPWHVIVWALKRYQPTSWHDIMQLAPDLAKRGPRSLRQTVRRNVEEPLAYFYRDLTGNDLDPSLYSCALSDAADSTVEARDRMRALKRAARTKSGNPAN